MGGNHKPQTFRDCAGCGARFGPLPRLARRFCSRRCVIAARSRRRRSVLTPAARRAHSAVARAIAAGKLVRATACEACGRDGCRIEAAHHDYATPLRVRWLCRGCHVRWDRAEPKGGSVSVAL